MPDLALLWSLVAALTLLLLLRTGFGESREAWAGLSLWSVAALVVISAASAVAPWHVFDLVQDRPMGAHEDQLFQLLSEGRPHGNHGPYEVNPLLRDLYWVVGLRVGRTLEQFATTASVVSSLVPLLAGLAFERWQGRGVGVVVALLLALDPDAFYWRTQAFHVAPAHQAFALCLLASALVARQADLWTLSLWGASAALTATFRIEYASACVATAVLPLWTHGFGLVRRWRLWPLPLLLTAALMVIPLMGLTTSITEDQAVGWRFVRYYLGAPELLGPVATAGGLALGVAALLGLRKHNAGPVGLLLVAGALSLLPAACFSGFGMRHTLPARTLWYGALVLGVYGLGRLWPLGLAGLGVFAWFSVAGIEDLRDRWGGQDAVAFAEVPGLPRPEGPPPDDLGVCVVFSDSFTYSETLRDNAPLKDARDPAIVARDIKRTPAGCGYLGIGPREGLIWGARHERWVVLSRLYDLEPAGRLPPLGNDRHGLDLYRILRLRSPTAPAGEPTGG